MKRGYGFEAWRKIYVLSGILCLLIVGIWLALFLNISENSHPRLKKTAKKQEMPSITLLNDDESSEVKTFREIESLRQQGKTDLLLNRMSSPTPSVKKKVIYECAKFNDKKLASHLISKAIENQDEDIRSFGELYLRQLRGGENESK